MEKTDNNEVSEILQKAVMSSEDIDSCLQFLKSENPKIEALKKNTIELNWVLNNQLRLILLYNQ